MRILLVDNEAACRDLLEAIIGNRAWVDHAETGEKGLARFLKARRDDDPYSIVFLDIMMPGIDGQEVLDRMRAIECEAGILPGHGAKIVMVSGLDKHDEIFESFRKQCDAYIIKPATVSVINETLEKVM